MGGFVLRILQSARALALAALMAVVPALHGLAASSATAPDDPLFGQQSALLALRAPEAWETWKGSGAASVCSVGTGVRHTHEDLATRYRGGASFVGGSGDPWDPTGHTTRALGLAAAGLDNGIGIAGLGNVGIYVAQVLVGSGAGVVGDVASAIAWCDARPDTRLVILVDLAWTSGTQAVESAIRAAVSNGRILVAPVGHGSAVAFPASLQEVLGVGCITLADAGCAFSAHGAAVDIVAPGVDALSTDFTADDAYATASGTTMSAGFVAGALALYWSHAPDAAAHDVMPRLLRSAREAGPAGHDVAFGCGALDVKALFDGPPAGAPCGGRLLSPPRGLSATSGEAAGEIALSWLPPSFVGEPLVGYRVWRADSCDGTFTLVVQTSASTTGHVDGGLGDGVSRCYRVSAVADEGASEPSATAEARTLMPPGAPAALRAEPGPEPQSVRLRWHAPPPGDPFDGFVIERRGPEEDFVAVATVGRTLAHDDGGLDLTAAYAYRVRAYNVVGEGAPSGIACARPSPWPTHAQAGALECALADLWPAPPR